MKKKKEKELTAPFWFEDEKFAKIYAQSMALQMLPARWRAITRELRDGGFTWELRRGCYAVYPTTSNRYCAFVDMDKIDCTRPISGRICNTMSQALVAARSRAAFKADTLHAQVMRKLRAL